MCLYLSELTIIWLQVCKLEMSVKVPKLTAPAAPSVSPGWGLMRAPGMRLGPGPVSTASTLLPWQRGSHVTTAGRLDLAKTAPSAVGRLGSVKVEIITLFFIFIQICIIAALPLGGECWSQSAEDIGQCTTGAECLPWLPDGGTWDGVSAKLCLHSLTEGQSCDYTQLTHLCDRGLRCHHGLCEGTDTH